MRLDYTWLLAVGDLCVHDVVRHLGIDLGVETLAREGAQLGLIHGGADRAMRWTLGRMALHSGPRSIDALGDDDIDRFLVAVRTFGERPDLDSYWTSAERCAGAWIGTVGRRCRFASQSSRPSRRGVDWNLFRSLIGNCPTGLDVQHK